MFRASRAFGRHDLAQGRRSLGGWIRWASTLPGSTGGSCPWDAYVGLSVIANDQRPASAATQWLRGLWEYYRGYTDTAIHAVATAALTAFGLLVFVDSLFALLAIASYLLPPVVLYVLGADAGKPSEPPETAAARTTARAEPTSNPDTDSGHGDGDSDSDSDDGDTDSDSDDGDTDSDSDDGDTDSDSDDGDTDSDN